MKKELLIDFKDAELPVVQRIFLNAQKDPEQPAIICKDEITDYGTLCRMISAITVWLQDQGIKKGDRVAVQAMHDKYCIAAFYAIHRLGAILVPLEKNAPEMRIREIMEDTGSQLLIANKMVESVRCHSYEEVAEAAARDSVPDLPFPAVDEPCEMVFTTGTTGKSKGVLIAHRNISWYVCSVAKAIRMKENNRFFITTPLNHAGGLRRTHLSLANGCTVVYMDGLMNLRKYFSYIENYEVTSLYLPPVAIRMLINHSRAEMGRFAEQIDFVYSSSSPLPIGDSEELRKMLPHSRLYNAYEASETPGVSVYDYNSDELRKNCMGKANPGVELALLDDEGKIFSESGREGRICIKSPMNMLGYFNAEELTASVMKDDWFVSNDLGVFDADGNIYYNGRKGDVINIGGYKIAPIDVEETALLSGMVDECICIQSADRSGYPILKLLAVAKEGLFDAKQLTAFIKDRLEAYKVPREIETVAEVHKTFNGKIDRKYYRKPV